MSRETLDEKAARYLAEGRLTVMFVGRRNLRATCAGRELYRLGFDDRGWWCDCPAYGGCAHIAALRLVTVPR